MSDIEWGPEIEVNGVKPEWLAGHQLCWLKTYDWIEETKYLSAIAPEHWTWSHDNGQPCIKAIRLPKDHPYYANKTEEYDILKNILNDAYEQAANGKGKERHANGKPWDQQPIAEIGRMVGVGFNTGQAIKKLQESSRMEPDAACRELMGAIVYAASAIMLIRENDK